MKNSELCSHKHRIVDVLLSGRRDLPVYSTAENSPSDSSPRLIVNK